jgi:hypothetical protein
MWSSWSAHGQIEPATIVAFVILDDQLPPRGLCWHVKRLRNEAATLGRDTMWIVEIIMAAKPQIGFWDARECAPGPQGRPNRPPSTIPLVVGRRRRPIDGRSISQTDSYVAGRAMRAAA